MVGIIVALASSEARAERPLSVALLPPLLDDLVEMLLPFEVEWDLGPQRGSRLWILESRYCGATADGAGRFVAIAVPAFSSEDKATRSLAAEDCERGLVDVAHRTLAARKTQAWVAAVGLEAVWKPSHLRWRLMDARAAGRDNTGVPTLPVPEGGLTIGEVSSADVRVAVDGQLDLTVQLAAAFADDFARVSVSRTPLESAPKAGPLERSGAPSATRAIARLPHESVTSILQRDLIEQELVFDHPVSGPQRFLIQQARVSSPGPEAYVVSGRSLHVGTDEAFTIRAVFRGDDLQVESMALAQQLRGCGSVPPTAEFEALTAYAECMAESAFRRGAAEAGSTLLTQTYQGRKLRPTGPPTPIQIWLDGHHFTVAAAISKASVRGDALVLYLEPNVSRGISAP